MLAYFGRSYGAQWFAMSTFTGRGSMTMPMGATYDDPRTASWVREPLVNAWAMAYHNPTYDRYPQGGIRDELTRESLDNVPELPEDWDDESRQAPSHTEKLYAIAKASRQEALERGWSLLAERQCYQSKQAFDSAHMLDRDDPTALVGKLLCSVIDGEEWSAGAYMLMLANRYDNMFSVRHSLAEAWGDTAVAEALLTRLASTVAEDPKSAEPLALRAYLLWLDGQNEAALNTAKRLRENFRTSPFADFEDGMQKQLRAETEAAS